MKSILITGGSSGIGKALVELSLKNKYKVFFTYLNNEKVAKLLSQRKNCFAIKANLASDNDVTKIFSFIAKKVKKIDCIVNNASQTFKKKRFQDLDIKEIKNNFDVNVLGTYRICLKAIKYLKKNSLIINITSTAAKFGGNMLTHYAPTKAAIENLTIGLSRDLSNLKIRVVNVSPGIINTVNMKTTNKIKTRKDIENLNSTIPSGRLGTAREVAEVIIWLNNKEASYINGTTLTINGGR